MHATHSSLLHCLPPAIFTLVTQLLPLPDKLLQFTHVSHCFPALTALSFTFDTLVCTPTLISKLSSSPPPPLLSLLSHVPYAVYVDPVGDALLILCRFLQPPSGAPPLPSLRAVTIIPHVHVKDYGASFASLPKPLAGLSLCPHLTALDLCVLGIAHNDRSRFLRSLSSLRSLRTLRFTGRVLHKDLLFCLSLPLTSLDLSGCEFDLSARPPARFPPLPPLRSLLLGYLHTGGGASDNSALWTAALLPALAAQQTGDGAKLERLLLCIQAASQLSYIPLLRHLHTLQLHVRATSGDERLFVDFYTALISSPLPLRHLSLDHELLNEGPQGDRRPSSAVPLVPALISAYAGQLLSLELRVSLQWTELEDERQPVGLREQMTAALLSCHGLRRLFIFNGWLSAAVAVPSAPALPDLESLALLNGSSTLTLDDAALAVLLDAAPHLQELDMRASKLPSTLVLWISEHCHELRTLIMTAYHDVAIDSDTRRWHPLPPRPALPHLTSLFLVSAPPVPTEHHLGATLLTEVFSFLVHSTPALRYLRLPFKSDLKEHGESLSLLGGLTQLKGLHLGVQRWMDDESLERFWHTDEEPRLLREARGEERDIWGEHDLPKPTCWWWKPTSGIGKSRGGMMSENELLQQHGGMYFVRREAEGTSAARGLFEAVKDGRDSVTPASHGPNVKVAPPDGDDGEEKGGKRSRLQ